MPTRAKVRRSTPRRRTVAVATKPSRPAARLLDPSLDVGLDLKTALTSGLSLVGTLNPDFGQPVSSLVAGPAFQAPFMLRIGARFEF